MLRTDLAFRYRRRMRASANRPVARAETTDRINRHRHKHSGRYAIITLLTRVYNFITFRLSSANYFAIFRKTFFVGSVPGLLSTGHYAVS
jgi:hypothetical protein